MNLLMMAPLLDSRGNLRYFIGAQVDVSGLVKDSSDLDAFQRMLAQQAGEEVEDEPKDEFQELSEMFNHSELETVRKHGGHMHKEHLEDQDDRSSVQHRPRVLIKDMVSFDPERTTSTPLKAEGRLAGVYKHVSPWTSIIQTLLIVALVSTHPSGSFTAHSLCLAISPCSRYPAIALP